MRRFVVLSATLFVAAVFVPAAASAYCCSNAAICQAVCGSNCCGKGSDFGGGRKSSLTNFSNTDLQEEMNNCRDSNKVQAPLRKELSDRRSADASDALKESEAKPQRQPQ